jgi:hypothetical protein
MLEDFVARYKDSFYAGLARARIEQVKNEEIETELKLVRALQTELKRVGCDPGAIGGNWGPKAKDALAQFARHAKVELKSDEPTEELLQQLNGQKGPVCPPFPRAQPQKEKEVVRSPKRVEAPSKGTAGSSCWTKCMASDNSYTNNYKCASRCRN